MDVKIFRSKLLELKNLFMEDSQRPGGMSKADLRDRVKAFSSFQHAAKRHPDCSVQDEKCITLCLRCHRENLQALVHQEFLAREEEVEKDTFKEFHVMKTPVGGTCPCAACALHRKFKAENEAH